MVAPDFSSDEMEGRECLRAKRALDKLASKCVNLSVKHDEEKNQTVIKLLK